jgi:hypothetical protein
MIPKKKQKQISENIQRLSITGRFFWKQWRTAPHAAAAAGTESSPITSKYLNLHQQFRVSFTTKK